MLIFRVISFAALVLAGFGVAFAGTDRPTQFSNQGSIANTRHNMTQRPPDNSRSLNAGVMDPYRNNYEEVCVYCHTPHGGNSAVVLPLWNRTLKATTYTTLTSWEQVP